jgi:hypothetical protein
VFYAGYRIFVSFLFVYLLPYDILKDEAMKTILISALTILLIVVVYFLFFHQSEVETTRIAGSGVNSLNSKFASNHVTDDQMGLFNKKLSMKQIDSITALENYNFTIQNYGRDVVLADSIELKNKKRI